MYISRDVKNTNVRKFSPTNCIQNMMSLVEHPLFHTLSQIEVGKYWWYGGGVVRLFITLGPHHTKNGSESGGGWPLFVAVG